MHVCDFDFKGRQMSQAHAQKFYDIVAKDPALLKTLGTGTKSAEEFLARAVAAGKQQGLEFTAQEAEQYVIAQNSKNAVGELSDQQLEAVAGGKISVTTPKVCYSGTTPEVVFKSFASTSVGYSWGWN
jgi:hypothetical protein